ncbi:MAG: hypothetical protein EBU90_10235 [Proteobacteria bacterium]|nr:hypothetical protein [Pseudomonadota bacterium]NBP13787.1 hypothetical protein [bacterium]
MKLPLEILSVIEGFSDHNTRKCMLILNVGTRHFLLKKYDGYVLYMNSSSLIYDSYKVILHKSKSCLDKYIKQTKDQPLFIRHVRLTLLGRAVAEEFKSIRIYDETAYIQNSVQQKLSYFFFHRT